MAEDHNEEGGVLGRLPYQRLPDRTFPAVVVICATTYPTKSFLPAPYPPIPPMEHVDMSVIPLCGMTEGCFEQWRR